MEWVVMKLYQNLIILIMHCPNTFLLSLGISFCSVVKALTFDSIQMVFRSVMVLSRVKFTFLLIALNFIIHVILILSCSHIPFFLVSTHNRHTNMYSTRCMLRPKCRFMLLDCHSDWSCIANYLAAIEICSLCVSWTKQT